MVQLRPDPVTPEAWAPFGWLPRPDSDPADGQQTLHFEWADPHLNVITHAHDEVEHTETGALCSVMYRHDTHTQALMPINCDAIVAVAPAEVDFSDAAHIDTVRAFLLHPLDVFVLHRGTWHWGPFPVGSAPVQLLNVQGRRYAEDNRSVDLSAATNAVVEVTVQG